MRVGVRAAVVALSVFALCLLDVALGLVPTGDVLGIPSNLAAWIAGAIVVVAVLLYDVAAAERHEGAR